MFNCVPLFVTPGLLPPGSSVHGIFQARILEWVAISSSRGSSQPRDWACISCVGRWILYHWTSWEAHRGFYYMCSNFSILWQSLYKVKRGVGWCYKHKFHKMNLWYKNERLEEHGWIFEEPLCRSGRYLSCTGRESRYMVRVRMKCLPSVLIDF